MKLNYKASNIAKAEREYKLKFFTVMGGLGSDMGVGDLLFLYVAGGGSEDDFDKLFETGIEEVMIAIMEGINDAGFLGKMVSTSELRDAMAKAKTPAAVSPTSGATAKK
jgi:hypothetical protein